LQNALSMSTQQSTTSTISLLCCFVDSLRCTNSLVTKSMTTWLVILPLWFVNRCIYSGLVRPLPEFAGVLRVITAAVRTMLLGSRVSFCCDVVASLVLLVWSAAASVMQHVLFGSNRCVHMLALLSMGTSTSGAPCHLLVRACEVVTWCMHVWYMCLTDLAAATLCCSGPCVLAHHPLHRHLLRWFCIKGLWTVTTCGNMLGMTSHGHGSHDERLAWIQVLLTSMSLYGRCCCV